MKSSEKIVGSYLGRPQSPAVELLMQELIYDVLKGLMEESYLYRSQRIDLAVILAKADAVGAAACGDVCGAFYHLRTLLEHHMKTALDAAIAERVDGDDLCARYNQIIDPVLRDRGSLKSVFDTCSANLHNRTGTLADYANVVETVCNHFKLVETHQKLNPGSK